MIETCGRGPHVGDVPQIASRRLPWMEADWSRRLGVFKPASRLEIVLSGSLDTKTLLYQSSPFMKGIFSSSFQNVAVHTNVKALMFTIGLERVGSRWPTTSVLLGRRRDRWYYFDGAT